MEWKTNPWDILSEGLTSLGTVGADKSTEVMKSIYALLRTVGLIGCAVTMIIIIIKFLYVEIIEVKPPAY